MNITILLYDNFTGLDPIGPYEVLRLLPGARIQFVASTAGIQQSDARSLGLVADRDLSSVRSSDVLVVPGGPGQEIAERDPRKAPGRVIDLVRQMFEQLTRELQSGAAVAG